MPSKIRRAALLFSLSIALSATASAQTVLCENGECLPMISQVTYFERPAYRLTDGKTEAIIVPEIGRIMSYGKVGGANLLWNSPTKDGLNGGGWKNYGGDKTWLSPQSSWQEFHGKAGWPPDNALDGSAYKPDVLTGGKLQMTSPLSPSGIRLTRTMYFDDKSGEFVIEQMARKEKGAPIRASIWSITQVVPGQVTFLPANANSTYPNSYARLQGQSERIELVNPNLLRLFPYLENGGAKFGIDAPVSALVSVHDQVAFLQKTTQPTGEYPDAKGGAGFPVEVFVSGDPANRYIELELLGPLKTFSVGGKSTQTVKWSLHNLPSRFNGSPEITIAIEKLLYGR
ncbi:MAG TPA: hypothetical protein VF627_00620 [Abditibacterium sp.]|jgi:hypothetical protein